MRLLLLIITSLFLLTTCTHDGKNITVKGRVYNPVTGEGFSDCTVMLLKNKADAPGPNAGSTDIVATVRPDADGYYELNHTSMFPRDVWIDFDEGTNYYLLGWVENGEQTVNTSPKDVHLGKYTFLDYTAVPNCEFKIHTRNDNCQGPGDTLQVFLDGFQYGYDDYQIGKIFELYGCVDLLTDPSYIFPAGKRYYHWKVIRSGVANTYYGSILLQPDSLNVLNIFY